MSSKVRLLLIEVIMSQAHGGCRTAGFGAVMMLWSILGLAGRMEDGSRDSVVWSKTGSAVSTSGCW